MFPQRLDSPLAYDIAKALLDGLYRKAIDRVWDIWNERVKAAA